MNNAAPNHFYVNRSLLESDRWLAEKFTRGQAWVDLCGLAHHRPRTIVVNGVSIYVPRGCVAYSQLTLSKRWKWSRKKVAAQLKQWVHHNDCTIIKTDATNFCLIQLVKYDFWQGGGTTDGATDYSTDYSTKDTQSKNEENDKNEKKVSSDDDTPQNRMIVESLYDGMLKTNEAEKTADAKNPKRRAQKCSAWLKNIGQLKRIEGATDEQINYIIRWLFTSEKKNALFWQKNIRSGKTLREKWTQLVANCKEDVLQKNNNHVFIS